MMPGDYAAIGVVVLVVLLAGVPALVFTWLERDR